MVNAYAVLANHGIYRSPSYLISICDRNGSALEVFEKDKKGHRALSREASDLMVHMMRTVVSEGTGSALRSKYGITNDVAGKTGTTQSNVDGWFIAVMPKLVIGAWVGSDDPRMHFSSTALGQGSVTALPIVGKFLVKANQDKGLRNVVWKRFEPLPDNLLAQLDCKPSKSNKNLFERIFQPRKKKGVKITKFKNRGGKNS
jgi:penicillin-binding protein 1A